MVLNRLSQPKTLGRKCGRNSTPFPRPIVRWTDGRRSTYVYVIGWQPSLPLCKQHGNPSAPNFRVPRAVANGKDSSHLWLMGRTDGTRPVPKQFSRRESGTSRRGNQPSNPAFVPGRVARQDWDQRAGQWEQACTLRSFLGESVLPSEIYMTDKMRPGCRHGSPKPSASKFTKSLFISTSVSWRCRVSARRASDRTDCPEE